jgi:glycosyltransferase involved in cell wall biosynthesis
LVKQADALEAAGYQVRIVAVSLEHAKWQLDQALMPGRNWKLNVVTASRKGPGRRLWFYSALRQKFCLRAVRIFPQEGLVIRASSRHGVELAQLARSEQADLFIAYKLQVLPAAAQAAQQWKAKLGFDVEDFHTGMRRFGAKRSREEKLNERIEAEYLPRCNTLTAASPGVASAVSRRYGQEPVPLLNVFPLAERPAKRQDRPIGAPLRLHWFSHVVGPDRGLEDAVRALRLLPAGSTELHLRAQCDDSGRRYLERLIDKTAVSRRAVVIHAPVPPNLLVSTAAEYDVGLALEVPISENRMICMRDLCTNKVFTYLLAGLAVAASGLEERASIYDGAGFAYRTGDASQLAAGLRQWIDNPDALEQARKNAWRISGERYNWDMEKEKLLRAIEKVLPN